MINSSLQWDIRSAIGKDLPFIYATWSKSYRYDSALGKSCKSDIFFKEYNKVIDAILIDRNTEVRVACSTWNPEIIFGYIVYEKPNIAHYLYVKEAFYAFGIAKALFYEFDSIEIVTHKTMMVKPILVKYKLIYNPFLLFKRKEMTHEQAS